MQDATGLDARLTLRWNDQAVQGVLPRRGSFQPVDSFVDAAVGLLAVFVAGVAVPAAMTSLMLTAGIAGWRFPALIAGLFLAGVSVLALHLVVRVGLQAGQLVFGVRPWRFRITLTHVEWAGAEPQRQRSRMAWPWSFGRSPLRVPLTRIDGVEPGTPGLQLTLDDGETLLLDVDSAVPASDLDDFCAFLMHRVALARAAAEGRRVTEAEARAALGPVPQHVREAARR